MSKRTFKHIVVTAILAAILLFSHDDILRAGDIFAVVMYVYVSFYYMLRDFER